MDTVQILKDARAIIADEKSWTRGYYSRDDKGCLVLPYDKGAKCFCSLGAIHKVSGLFVSMPLPEEVLKPFAGDAALGSEKISTERKIIRFNDASRHHQVLALFDRAIARAESEAVQ